MDSNNSDAESVKSKTAESYKGKAKERIIEGLADHRGAVLIFVPGKLLNRILREQKKIKKRYKKITVRSFELLVFIFRFLVVEFGYT